MITPAGKSLKKEKDKAWKAFSRFIRTRDCIKSTGDVNDGICVTCKKTYPYKSLQAGHFISGRTNAVLFDEIGVNAQCYGCNVGRGGAHVEYFVFMEQVHGREVIDQLRQKRHQTVKYTVFDYERIRKEYDEKYEALIANI